MLLCVLNISEGRRPEVIAAIADTAGDDLLDIHSDAEHHRSVLTLVGEGAARAVTVAAVEALDLRHHRGAHPRLGVVDVVPFVPLGDHPLAGAIAARDRFVSWVGDELGIPAFPYGPDSGNGPGLASLPEIRRSAFTSLAPAAGPRQPHPRAGATSVGARPALVAYNLWLAAPDLDLARSIARSLRSPAVRALGLRVGDAVQVSCNLVEPHITGPDAVYDTVARQAPVRRAELVGLVPEAVLTAIDPKRWTQLDLSPERTLEARLGSFTLMPRPPG